MRRIVLALVLAVAAPFASVPVFAADAPPAPAPVSTQASDADVGRLLEVMGMQSMMDDMLKQMSASQEAMVVDAFGKDLSDAERGRMQDVLAKANALTLKHLSWAALEPIMRKVYAQVFSKQEVDAMVAFYSSPEGSSILKKAPQAMALSMQEMQPLVRDTMAEVKAMVDEEIAADKPRK